MRARVDIENVEKFGFGDQTVVSLNYFQAFGYRFVQHKYDAQADKFLQARQEAKDESGQG